MTSSSEELVVRADRAAQVTPLSTPDLSAGAWTRLGRPGVRGDAVTEETLSTLADRTRAAAHAQGYAVGWAQGMREADAAARRDVPTRPRERAGSGRTPRGRARGRGGRAPGGRRRAAAASPRRSATRWAPGDRAGATP